MNWQRNVIKQNQTIWSHFDKQWACTFFRKFGNSSNSTLIISVILNWLINLFSKKLTRIFDLSRNFSQKLNYFFILDILKKMDTLIFEKNVCSFSKIWTFEQLCIQHASRNYNLGLTPILILLQEASPCYLWMSLIITNVFVAVKWHNWLLYFMCRYTNLNLPLGFNNIYSLFNICSSCNFYDLD